MNQHLVLYDGDCPLCIFQMRVLTWLDWFNTLDREQLLAAMHCVTRDGRIHRGARCIRFVGMRLPLLFPLALLLWVPGVIWIAEKIYNLIARNRKVLSRLFGCKEACSILPARKREQDEVR